MRLLIPGGPVDGLPAPAEAEDAWMVSWVFPAGPSAVADARRATRDRLTRWGIQHQVMVAELLVGGLLTDALGRICDRVRLTLMTEDGFLRCEVEHLDPPSPDEEVRGHRWLSRLACCWGTAQTPEGKVVWFELPVSDQTCSSASAPA
ncbi:hypothetical protein [Nonomuraea lactucae]|uniref:hypothetical protein n=1 Tax=Nonomuraea lactucae TaxID=2249762 RepID=UPI000DE1C29D|nr:hypothetical protein [Nonomuraea lactucae]